MREFSSSSLLLPNAIRPVISISLTTLCTSSISIATPSLFLLLPKILAIHLYLYMPFEASSLLKLGNH
jgi:hypothetical protein